MPVTLQNTRKRMVSYNLEHPSCHEDGYGKIHSIELLDTDPKTGMGRAKLVKRRISGSLTFPAGGTLTDLPNSVLRAKGVTKAVKAGHLVVLSNTPMPKKPPPKAAPPPPPKKVEEGGKK